MTRRPRAVAILAVVLALSGASPATASDAGSLASVVNGNDPSTSSGTNFDTVQVTAPTACDSASTRHVTKITGVTAKRAADQSAADAWVGDNLYATSSVGLPGPLTTKSSNSWQGLADTYGQQLVPATYEFVLRCQDNLGTVIHEEWSGQVVFSSRKAWTGSTGGPGSSGSTATAAPDSSGETSSASPDGASPSEEPSDSESTAVLGSGGSGIDSGSESGSSLAATGATVAGILLLGGLFLAAGVGLVTLSRRRRDRPTISTGR